MLKVYLPSFAICTLSLTVNLLALGTYPLGVIARETELPTSNKQAANNVATDLEPEILSEINRVRTNPQGYAHWLEEQKQYYDNIWLKLPGEEPIRAHKLGKAIDEAIAILKEQQPLPPLDVSEQTSAIAAQKLEDFGTTNNSIQNISYGRQTAKGIVMSLVVDELFRDRRRRKSLLSSEANDTGVVCKSDPRYAKVCAIAYSNSSVDEPVAQQPENNVAQTEVKQPDSPPKENEADIEKTENINDSESTSEDETITENVAEDTENIVEKLPQPPKPQALPIPPIDVSKPDSPTPETKPEAGESDVEIARTDLEDEIEENEEELEEIEENEEELEEVEAEIEEVESELEEIEAEIAEEQEVFEAESEAETEIATNSDSSRLLENVERGALEEGDRTIEEDGSFYDSYPLEAKSGESFTIALESSEFDAFVALVDAKGNIVEQNDDISEEDSNSRIRVTIPENGVYNVIVNAYNKGGTGQYVLTVTR